MTTATIAPMQRASSTYISPNARRMDFGERIKLNPRPTHLTAEDVVRFCLEYRGALYQVARRFGIDCDPTDFAIDVAARTVECKSHIRYTESLNAALAGTRDTLGSSRGSFKSYLLGIAFSMIRKQHEIQGRRDRILREGVAKQPPKRIEAPADRLLDREASSASIAAIRSRLTPTESKLLTLIVRAGRFDPEHAANALGIDRTYARELMAGIRRAVQFTGL